jgi:ribonuclease BN (tRNA processing enzyme)
MRYKVFGTAMAWPRMNRRSFLAGVAGATMSTMARGESSQSKTRLILLGTGGGPRPRKARASPSQVIVVNGAAYVIDCGDGVARQLVSAEVPLASIRHVFITHHHSDHNAGYGNLLLLAWTGGLRTRVDTWGPEPIETITKLFFEMSAFDIDTRIADEGRVPLVPLVHAHDIAKAGIIVKEDDVTVTAARVHHPPIANAFAYRFDTRDRSIVISGDTAMPADALIALARGADVLVHEVVYPAAIERLVAPLPNAATLKKSILAHHTSPEDVGRIAQAADVKTLVLSHFVPAEDASITDEMWTAPVRAHYRGRVILGKDLLEI